MADPKKPEGWWSIVAQGSRVGVVKAVGESGEIPMHAKTFLTALLDAVEARFNFIHLDAHFNVDGAKPPEQEQKTPSSGRANLHITIVPSTKLL